MKITFCLLIVAALLLNGCGDTVRGKAAAPPASPVAVSTVAAATENWPSTYEATGTVRAQTSMTVASRISGYVRDVKAQTGDSVREGQVLITLDARDLDVTSKHAEAARDEIRLAVPEADTAVTAASANLDLAQVTAGRMRELFQKKSISNQEMDEATAKLKAAQAGFEMAKARRAQLNSRLATAEQDIASAGVARSYAEVAAPFAGIVVARSVEPGNLAMQGAPLLTIERAGLYRLEVSVDESRLSQIRAGQAVSVSLDGIERQIQSRVAVVVPAVDSASRTYTVKIDLPAIRELRSGQFGRAGFQVAERNLLAIPTAALVTHGQLQTVFVAGNGIARTRLITTGERAQDRIEVLSGLAAGERIVVPIPSGLSDGTPVELRQ